MRAPFCVSTLFTFCPPGPDERQVSNFTSLLFHGGSCLISKQAMPINQFLRLLSFRNGLLPIHCTVPNNFYFSGGYTYFSSMQQNNLLLFFGFFVFFFFVLFFFVCFVFCCF